MANVELAGFTIDLKGLDEKVILLKNGKIEEADKIILTPETIAASYARISRDARSIRELREEARKDIETSRKSNKAIIFTMGHKSIAEHGVFNIDFTEISRRAVEEVESKRLCSYTEKSQRYITMQGDFILPKEIQGTPLESLFLENIELQNNFYKNNLEKITNWHHEQDYSELYPTVGAKDAEKQKGVREGLGKEDARYSLAMATQAQIGETISARNLEVLITKLRSSDNKEFKELGEKIFNIVDGFAPSLIKYTQPVEYFSRTRKELKEKVSNITEEYSSFPSNHEEEVRLFTGLKRDDSIIAGLIFSSSSLNYQDALKIAKSMNDNEKLELRKLADIYQAMHDPKLREYELGDRVAEFSLSSSAFAQMKRHRMNTLIPQRYLLSLSHTTPESIKSAGLKEEFEKVMNDSNYLYEEFRNQGLNEDIAEYCLTNAHKRRVLLDANNRQVHAICAERLNLAAQWDIRNLIGKYAKLIQLDSPITTMDLCGKHEFYEMKEKTQSF